jgi:phosphatidylserine decarboxylase
MNKDHIEKTRFNNRLPVAREGIPFILIILVVTLVLFLSGFTVTGLAFTVITLFVIYFFRDPDREKAAKDNEIISPADGRIVGVWHLEPEKSPTGEGTIKISIFMSVFNVHVNRAPASGEIAEIKYNPGRRCAY